MAQSRAEETVVYEKDRVSRKESGRPTEEERHSSSRPIGGAERARVRLSLSATDGSRRLD